MKSQERKTLAYIAGIAGALGIILATVALFIKKKDMLVVATILLLVSSIVVMSISIVDGYANQGDFNAALKSRYPKLNDDHVRCASNIISASILQLFNDAPGLGKVMYSAAREQALNNAKCDEGLLDDIGMCVAKKGKSGDTCGVGGLVAQNKCKGADCNFASLQTILIEAIHGGIGPYIPSGHKK